MLPECRETYLNHGIFQRGCLGGPYPFSNAALSIRNPGFPPCKPIFHKWNRGISGAEQISAGGKDAWGAIHHAIRFFLPNNLIVIDGGERFVWDDTSSCERSPVEE